MLKKNDSHLITDISELQKLYGEPNKPSLVKELDYIHPIYKQFIELAPFVVVSTGGPDGIDGSPRGDAAGFVIVEDEHTLLIPDRPGNNRIDSLGNILKDPRIALLFLIPGIGETIRANGRASISIDPDLLARFVVNGKPPRSVMIVDVETIFFQCAKALVRSDLWNPDKRLERKALPSTGTILAEVSKDQIDAEEYDKAAPKRQAKMMY